MRQQVQDMLVGLSQRYQVQDVLVGLSQRPWARVLLALVLARWLAQRVLAHLQRHHTALPLMSLEDNFDDGALGWLGSTGATVLERVEAFKRFPTPPHLYKEKLFGLASCVATTNPEHMAILTKLEKSARINVISNFVGKESVAFQVGSRGKRDRQSLNAAFTAEKLEEDLFPAMRESAQAFVHRLASLPSYDPMTEYSKFTFHVINQASFGSSDLANETKDDFLQMVSMALNPVVFLPFGVPLVKWYYRKSLANIQRVLGLIFAQREEDLRANGQRAKNDLLQVMMTAAAENHGQIDGGVSQQTWIEDNIKSAMFAGTDTTSVTLTYLSCLISTRPECQEKIKEELRRVVGPPGSELRFEHLAQLPYLTGVIKETLRLYPPALGVARTCKNDVVVDGIALPNGITFILDILNMQRREEFFSHAHDYIPERWIPGASKETCDENGFMPFSRGFRSCIGQNFAVQELKIVLAELWLTGKSIKPVSPIPTWPDGNLLKGTPSPFVESRLRVQ